jgi:hypothetical protein
LGVFDHSGVVVITNCATLYLIVMKNVATTPHNKEKKEKTMAMGEKLSAYQPSKAVWFWSCVGAAVLTMIVGFTWGGWVTGGTATKQAQEAGKQGAAQLAANICVHRFLAAPDAQAQLAEFKKADSWKRDTFVKDGGWVTFADMEKPVNGAAELCADQLASAEVPAATAAEAAPETTVN